MKGTSEGEQDDGRGVQPSCTMREPPSSMFTARMTLCVEADRVSIVRVSRLHRSDPVVLL